MEWINGGDEKYLMIIEKINKSGVTEKIIHPKSKAGIFEQV